MDSEADESTSHIVAVEIDQQTVCAGGNVRYAVRLRHDDPRVIPRVGFGARKGPGAVGVARQFKSHQEVGDEELTVDLVDALTGELIERRTVPVSFVACGAEEPRDELRPLCQANATKPVVTCRLADDVGTREVAWELRAVYVDGEGPPVVEVGPDIELELPIHEGDGSTETYLVTVEASAPGEAPLTGRTSIARPRMGFKERVVNGELLLHSQQLTPTSFLLVNTAPEALLLEDTLVLEHRPCASEGIATTEDVQTASVLGDTHMTAHERREIVWHPPSDPDACGYRIFFRGEGAESGNPLIGALRSR